MILLTLQAPASQGLGGANLVALKKEELREIDGGCFWLGVLIGVAIGIYLLIKGNKGNGSNPSG